MSQSATVPQHDAIRKEVSEIYTKAVTKPKASCCSSSCCATAEPQTLTTQTAGYSGTDLAEVPADAVANSFGCGNPLAFSGVREGDTVVDLGSGAGIDILIAVKKVGPSGRVIGIDMTDEMIARARKNIAASGHTNVEVRKGIIESMPVEDQSVDWVISNCVINLSPDKPKVFNEIARVLRPGGQMSVSDIVVERLPWWMRKSMRIYASCVGGAISEGEYLAGLRAAGLEGVEVRERIVYDAAQVGAVVSELLTPTLGRMGAIGRTVIRLATRYVSHLVVGNIWSAKVYARKPAA